MTRAEVDRLIAEQGIVKTGGQRGVAAILYTYRCTIACRHCCFGCAGQRPDVRMDIAKCVDFLGDLHQLGRVIHIAGGEAMLYWDDLRDVLRLSAARGVQPHFIESNASFATSDEIVRERLRVLQDCGVAGILLSTDPYHQAFVPPESFIRARRIAREVFGEANVWASNCSDEEVREHAAIARDEARLRDYVRAHPPTLVGTAHRFCEFLPSYTLAELPVGRVWRFPHTGRDCAIEFDREKIWEVHIDPYDNMQTNCGIILGNASETRVTEMIARGPADANFVTRLVALDGPFALAEFARQKHGFVVPERACSKCDLCYTVRRFLRPFYPDLLGPAEVYGD